MNYIRFSGTVNGTERSVTMNETFLAAWSLHWVEDGTEPNADDLGSIEAHVMNIEPLYRDFFERPVTDADYDAEVLNPKAEVVSSPNGPGDRGRF